MKNLLNLDTELELVSRLPSCASLQSELCAVMRRIAFKQVTILSAVLHRLQL